MKVIIVGAGIAGLSTSWALTKRCHQVTLLEQGPIPNPMAASGDHHRIIRRAYGKASGYGQMITEAYEAWDELWADLGVSHLDPRGFICISREEGDEAEIMRQGLEDGGYPLEVVQSDDAVARWPFLQAGAFRYAFFSPEGGALHCRFVARDLAAWLRKNGADLREHSQVTAVDTANARVTLASGEVLEADQVVVTAGAWVLKLFPHLAHTLTAWRTALSYCDVPADLQDAWERAPVILDVGGDTDGYIIPPTPAGGMKFGTGLHKNVTDDANADRTPRPGEGEEIRNYFAPPIARIEEYKVREVVTCAYTFTSDERFASFEDGRCLVVSACSGHGYKFGAAVGRRVAAGVDARDAPSLLRWLQAELA